MGLREKIGKEMLFFDGAMGTLLQEAGLPPGCLPESWNVEKPEVVKEIHRAYIDAGCHILKTNTFGANRIKFGKTPVHLIQAGIGLARQAIEESGRKDGFVAFDMSSTGNLLEPLGPLAFEEAYEVFSEMVLAARGADAILIETMTDTYELKAAVLAARAHSALPIFASVMVDQRGKLLTGGDVTSVVALLEGLGVDALGLNCGFGPAQMLPFVQEMIRTSSLPVLVNPNAGLPTAVDGKTIFSLSPDGFAVEMTAIAETGPWLLGGCCGTTPAHLAQLIAACKDKTPDPVTDKGFSLVSSYTHAIDLRAETRIIGEKLNPTGNKALSAAIKTEDTAALLDCALAQKQAGAQVIDVNVGVPGLEEERFLPQILRQIQEVVDTPLMIDTSHTAAMEAAARSYNGKPILNSVNGKEESLRTVLPIAAKYGGVIVGLTLDETGIPKTPEGRLKIAQKIVERAASYGIPRKDILIDPLTMAVSADPDAAAVTLSTLKAVKETLGTGTVLGVSNISFGLPGREALTRTFYTLALDHGLDAAIMNPFSQEMMAAYHGFRLLRGQDENSLEYIAFATALPPAAAWSGDSPGADPGGPGTASETASGALSGTASGTASNTNAARLISGSAARDTASHEKSLSACIIEGIKSRAAQVTRILLTEQDPMAVINDHIIPALAKVGDDFEAGVSFLPQLLMSAEAASRAFEVVKEHIKNDGATEKGKILLATVKGDIHDIGKNIVKVLLESYGYRVYDLGRDVPPEAVVETASREGIPLIGLSALMTTTVTSMEATIAQLKKAGHPCKIVVGGAVLTPEYARSIRADHYAKDAMATVHYAEDFFTSGRSML